MRNTQVTLSARPVGIPQSEHFAIVTADLPELADAHFRVRNRVLSVDPAMRGWTNAAPNYVPPVAVGEVMRSFAAGDVIESRHEGYPVGTRLAGMFGWQEYADDNGSRVTRVVPDDGLPLSLSLGVLGLTGATAWLGLLDLGRPQPGDVVVVSTAAGAVGSVVGQLAQAAGARAVAIAGGARKVALCRDEFGFDAAIDYRSPTFTEDLAAAVPDGVDVYFDNTAGTISDAVCSHLSVGARIVVCGTASVASWDPPPMGPRIERTILAKRVQMAGFLFFDHQHRAPEAWRRLAELVKAGRLRYREEFLDGLAAAPDAIAGLYRGENLGKRLIRLC